MYATQQDMIDRLTQDTVESLAWDGENGVIDSAAVDRALSDAADEIDARLTKRYQLPLTSVPSLLTRVAVNLAAYHLANGTTVSDSIKERYSQGIKLLESIAKGTADLGLPDAEKAATNTQGAVLIKGPERRLSRDSLKGVL